MKMVMALIPRDQADTVLEILIQQGYGVTFSESRGGFLRQAQKILFTAVSMDKLEEVLALIRENCKSAITVESSEAAPGPAVGVEKPEVGGAVVFVWDLDRFETYGWQT